MEQLRALLHRRIPLPQAWRRDVVLTSVCPSVIPPLRDVDTRDVNRFIPPPRPQISVTDKSPQHRRNNHGDQGRQVPPTFGFGGGPANGSNVLVLLHFWSNAASHHYTSPENILAQLNESAATQSPGSSACTCNIGTWWYVLYEELAL